MSDHHRLVSNGLISNTLNQSAAGVTAQCECGWSSGARFSSLIASALFRTHLEDIAHAEKLRAERKGND